MAVEPPGAGAAAACSRWTAPSRCWSGWPTPAVRRASPTWPTATGLPLPTIHRLVRSLAASGYVRQLPSRRYALGPGPDPARRLGRPAARRLGAAAPAGAGRPGRRERQHGRAGGRCRRVRRPGALAALDADVHRGRPPGAAALHRRRQGPAVGPAGRAGAGHRGPHRDAGPDRAHDHLARRAGRRARRRTAPGFRGRRRRAGARGALRRGRRAEPAGRHRGAVHLRPVQPGDPRPGRRRSPRWSSRPRRVWSPRWATMRPASRIDPAAGPGRPPGCRPRRSPVGRPPPRRRRASSRPTSSSAAGRGLLGQGVEPAHAELAAALRAPGRRTAAAGPCRRRGRCPAGRGSPGGAGGAVRNRCRVSGSRRGLGSSSNHASGSSMSPPDRASKPRSDGRARGVAHEVHGVELGQPDDARPGEPDQRPSRCRRRGAARSPSPRP